MALTGVIARFKTGSYTVTRTVDGGYDANGRVVAGSTSTFVIVASIQPVSGRALEQIPEGYRSKATRIVYTTTKLTAIDPTTKPDSVAIDGENWKVINVKRWEAFSETFYVAILAREVLTT